MTDSTISIGKIVATFGLKGELLLSHGLGKKSDFNLVKVLFVEWQRGSQIPYFVESAKAKSDAETLIKLEGVDSKETAGTLLQKQVWVSETDFQKMAAPNAPIALIGYTVLERNKVLGIVFEVIEQPHQVICSITMQGKEVLIPLNESTIKSIDRKAKKIMVSLPDGLLDVYLQ